MKKNINGSLHFTPNESCDLCILLTRIYLGNFDLTNSDLNFVKNIISSYLSSKIL